VIVTSIRDGQLSKEMTMARKKVATIDPAVERLTLVNVYEVEPDRQAALAKALSESTESTIRNQPGFVSVCIHSSLDGTKIVNYAQWESKEHFQNFMKDPETQKQLATFARLAKSVSPSIYRVDTVI